MPCTKKGSIYGPSEAREKYMNLRIFFSPKYSLTCLLGGDISPYINFRVKSQYFMILNRVSLFHTY